MVSVDTQLDSNFTRIPDAPDAQALNALIVESATDTAIFTTDLDGFVTTWNSGSERLFGYTAGEVLGRAATVLLWSQGPSPDRIGTGIGTGMGGAITDGAAPFEGWRKCKNGSLFFASGSLSPLKDESGAILGVLNIMRDRTSQHEADESLRRSEALARTLFESSADCVKILDLEGRLIAMNSPGMDMMEIDDFTPFEGQDWASLWPEEFRPDVDRAMQDAKAGRVGHFHGLCPTPKGTFKWWDVQVSPVPDADGVTQGLLSVSRDMSERMRGEEHRTMLIAELNHRVKNTLATVQAIAYQTLRSTDVDPHVVTTFEARLLALASAHDVLTAENWSGAHLSDIVDSALKPYLSGPRHRFDIEGPDVLLTPKVALAIAMALQELATNAAKYGALSRNYGRVSVHWNFVGDVEDRRLRLCWSETGGPPVQVPRKKGFGSRLIERGLSHELDGKAEIDFRPTGVVCTIEATMPSLSHTSGEDPNPAGAISSTNSLRRALST